MNAFDIVNNLNYKLAENHQTKLRKYSLGKKMNFEV